MAGKGYSSCCEVVKCKMPECNNQITLHGWGNEKKVCDDCIKKNIREQQMRAYYRRKENAL